MKKLLIILLCVSFVLCGCQSEVASRTFSTLQDFDGASVASIKGASFTRFIEKVLPGVNHVFYGSLTDEINALRCDRVDAIALDMPVAKLAEAQQSDLTVFPTPVASDKYGFAVAKGSPFLSAANEALERLKADGTIDRLAAKWFAAADGSKALDELNYKSDFDGSGGVLRCGCNVTTKPMCYVNSHGTPVGFDIDTIAHIAYELNMKIEFTPMPFDALLMSLSTNQIDVACSCLSITDERQQVVDFIGPYYEGGIVFVIKKSAYAAQ